ncbi:HIT family protein [Fusobacterium ulcerans]|uniref:HIT family protein n=1 Tax=Fusobacterium ulcerans TaxID=861 RepID=UPI0026727BEF|nr:HIT domain-containing protein [Fusobacterium ulcerans]
MRSNDCFYCKKDERLKELMIKICTIDCADIYFFKDQKHLGRCIVALNEHYTEMYKIPEKKLNEFIKVVSKVSFTIAKLFKADKVNYAVYGDIVPHFHVHLVPKKKDELQWGKPFTDDIEKKTCLKLNIKNISFLLKMN